MKEEMATAGTPMHLQKLLKLSLHGNPDGLNKQSTSKKAGFDFLISSFSATIKITVLFLILVFLTPDINAQVRPSASRGYSNRIKNYIDTLRIVDSHEHLFDPELLRQSTMNDFMLLFQHYNFNDFVSAGLDKKLWPQLTGDSLSASQKWNIISPAWEASFNTTYNRIALIAADRLYGINEINSFTVGMLSEKIKAKTGNDWFREVINEKCRIESLIHDGSEFEVPGVKIYNVRRFTPWLTVRTKYTVDSISMLQLKMIKNLEDFVNSLETAVKKGVDDGIVGIKINIAYSRTLNFEDVKMESARKVFRSIMDNPEEFKTTFAASKPLQDYMLFRLLDLAKKYRLPVAFHTGLMAGSTNSIRYADPVLMANLFQKYPEVNFVLFHGSYPYGGDLATLAKNFRNVYIDCSWIYAISPSYSERYLKEWIETVPASKIMAFGGDYSTCENVFGELIIARQVITKVLTEKVRVGYFSEDEAKRVAKMILHDSAVNFYNLK